MTRQADNKRLNAEKRGRRAELFAAIALQLKGYRIRARRFKTKAGEVDLIAQKGDLIVLVEVKARPTLMQAHEAISHTSGNRIAAAGDIWLSQQRGAARLSIRHDLIAVLPRRWPIHVPNAF